eukprot:1461390-Prymnesium_polylepis.2
MSWRAQCGANESRGRLIAQRTGLGAARAHGARAQRKGSYARGRHLAATRPAVADAGNVGEVGGDVGERLPPVGREEDGLAPTVVGEGGPARDGGRERVGGVDGEGDSAVV